MKRLLFLLLVFVVGASQAQTTWMVDSLNDSGFGSLRAAADSCSAGDTIRFNPNLIANGSDTLKLTTGEIAFNNIGVVIKGLYSDVDTLFISGEDSSNILFFQNAAKVVLDSLVFINGNGPASNGIFSNGGVIDRIDCSDTLWVLNCMFRGNTGSAGGAIHSSAFLGVLASCICIDNSIFSDNFCSSWNNGGAIYSFSSTSSFVFVKNSVVENNTSGSGGGISSIGANSSFVYVKGSTISGNIASSSTFGFGGGIFSKTNHSGAVSEVQILNSTITENSAQKGAGVYSYSIGSSGKKSIIRLTNSTFFENSASIEGGVVYSQLSNSTLLDSSLISVDNSTFVNNQAPIGQAIYGSSGHSEIGVSSSLFINNGVDSTSIYNSDSLTIISGGYNIFSDTLVGVGALDSVGIDSVQLLLKPLGFYGGLTKTMVPDSGSLAINGGNPNDLSAAQNRSLVGVRDVGAAEFCQNTFFTDSIQSCASYYTWINGVTYIEDSFGDTFLLTNSDGCDSLVTLHLTILHENSIDTAYGCDSVTWMDGNVYYPNHGEVTDTLINSMGCDSVVHLQFIPSNFGVDILFACDSLTWIDGVTYYSSENSVVDTLTSSFGCDSVVTLNLTIYQSFNLVDTVYGCDSLAWIDGNTYYSSNNSAVFNGVTVNGCDSIVELDLTINHPQTGIDSVSACLLYQWIDGQVYLFDNNTATHTLTGVNGCDSVVTLNLDLNYGTTGIDTHVVCDSLVWMDGNTYYSSSSSAYHTIIGGNSHGCDSVITLDLTVLGHRMVDDIISCEPYTWINGVTYASSISGPSVTYVNSNGCDSTITLNLLVASPTVNVDTVMACESYTWVNGVTYYANTDTPIDTLVSIYGCDSVVHLDLTILHSTSYTQKVSACSSFTWVNGVTYDQSISGPTHILTNSMGCDSLITLDFSLVDVNTSVVQNGVVLHAQADSGASFQWMVCGAGVLNGANNAIYTVLSNGSYQVEVTQDGCVDTSDCITVNNVGIGEVSLSNNINIYPNPVHDQVNIEITNWPTNGVAIVIRDITGKQVYTKEVEPISNKETIQINTSKWAKGTYFIEVGEDDNREVEQIVLQ